MPLRTTSVIRRRTVCATPALAPARRRRRRRSRTSAAAGARRRRSCRDGRHLQRRRQHLPLADRGRAHVQFALDRVGRRQRAFGGAGDSRILVEAELFGHRDEPRRAELDAERGEDRVARDREGEFQRAAAFLAVGVAQLHAVERRVGRVREGRARRREWAPSTPVRVTILNVDPGGCSAVEADPATARISPAGGLHRHDAAELAAQRGDGGSAGRAARSSCAARARGAAASATRAPCCRRQQLTAGRPRSRASSASSSPLVPTSALGGHPFRFERRRGARWDRADFADHRAERCAERRAARAGFGRAPSASTLPSRASSVARRGSVVRGVSVSPERSPGNASERDHSTRRVAFDSRRLAARAAARASRTAACATRTGTVTQRPVGARAACRGPPAVAVAVRRPRW